MKKQKTNFVKKYLDNDYYQGGLRMVIICTLAVILAVGVNLFAGLIPTKIGNLDLSEQKIYSVAQETEDMLTQLSTPVKIYYVCQPGNEYHNTEVMLNLYADASSNIAVERVDPAMSPDLLMQYTGETELTDNSLIVTAGDRTQVIGYSDYYTSGTFVLEDFLNSAIDYVTSEKLSKAYVLIGHDEEKIHSSTIAYMGLDGFDYAELNLVESKNIPEDASVVILNGIQEDITKEEADRLIAWLQEGGSFLLITDYTTASLENLQKVTSYFGASLGQGLIMESEPERYTDDNPAYMLPNIYSGSSTITKGINYMLLPNSMPILVDEEAEPDVKMTSLLESSENSYGVYTNIFTGEMISEQGPYTIAASFEKGELGCEGKMVWVTSKYVSDVTVSSAIGGGNITFFLNAVCWLGKDEPTASVHSKSLSSQQLIVGERDLRVSAVILMGVIPAMVLITGAAVLVWRKRR